VQELPSFNINSIGRRLPSLRDWLRDTALAVVCLRAPETLRPCPGGLAPGGQELALGSALETRSNRTA